MTGGVLFRAAALLGLGLAAGVGVGIFVGTRVPLAAATAIGAGHAADPGRPGAAAAPERVVLPAKSGRENPIETAEVTRRPLAPDVELVGSVGYDADRFAVVGPLIAGRVVTLRAGLGERVRAGQVLGELESAEVGQAQAAYLTARATTQVAQANLRRERELAERRVSSERERELAEAQAQTEQAQLDAAYGRLRALGLRPEDIRGLVGGAGGEAGRRAGRVPLTSPIDGAVIARQVTLGQAVQPATDAFTVADLTRLWVLLDLHEKDLAHVRIGQRAELRTDAHPGRTFPARVSQVGQVIDVRTRTTPVRVEFQNSGGELRPGQFVTAILHGDEDAGKDVLTAPRRAVAMIEGQPVSFVLAADGSFVRRAVEIGVAGEGLVEIRAGLKLGERVAADGAFLLKSEVLR